MIIQIKQKMIDLFDYKSLLKLYYDLMQLYSST